MRLFRSVASWRTGIVWIGAALATALAVSAVSAADERDRALTLAERATATAQIGTERRLEIARLLDETRGQLEALELELADAQEQRAELLEEILRLRAQLRGTERGSQSPSPGP